MQSGMKFLTSSACAIGIVLSSVPTFAADSISGQVVGAGAPIVAQLSPCGPKARARRDSWRRREVAPMAASR